MNDPATVRQEGQVLKEIQRHSSLSKELAEVVAKTEGRLASVLADCPKPESKPEAVEKGEKAVVSMAAQIGGSNNAIQANIHALCGILDRLEI